MVKPIYEFVLWDNCRNSCAFCWRKLHGYQQLNASQKKDALKQTLDFIKSSNFSPGSHVLLVGGELFDDEEVAQSIADTAKNIAYMMQTYYIDLLYVNTNLLNISEKSLKRFLEVFNEAKLFSRLKFTTSYDVVGRFSNQEKIDEWRRCLSYVKNNFNGINIVINCILTKQLCQQLASEIFNPVKYFNEKYGCYASVLPYIPSCKELVPTRTEVFSALKKIEEHSPGYIAKYVHLLDLKQPKIVLKFNGSNFEDKSALNASCGHCENLRLYSTGKTCFVCDLKTVFSSIL